MTRVAILGLGPASLVLGLAVISPSRTNSADLAAAVGPPWISVEMPANPLDPATRNAAFMVHAYHHEREADFELFGRAEGLVDGKRRSVALRFEHTGAGTFAVEQTWPTEGSWLVTVATAPHGDGPTLVLELGPDGGVTEERYYGTHAKSIALRSVRVMRGAPSARQINGTLQAMALDTR